MSRGECLDPKKFLLCSISFPYPLIRPAISHGVNPKMIIVFISHKRTQRTPRNESKFDIFQWFNGFGNQKIAAWLTFNQSAVSWPRMSKRFSTVSRCAWPGFGCSPSNCRQLQERGRRCAPATPAKNQSQYQELSEAIHQCPRRSATSSRSPLR